MTYGLQTLNITEQELPRWEVKKDLNFIHADNITENELSVEKFVISNKKNQYVDFNSNRNENGVDVIPTHKSWSFTGFHPEDGSFCIIQRESPIHGDLKLNFGPLDTTLDKLMWDGYFLSIEGFKHQRKVKLKLINDKKRDGYVLYNAPLFEFFKHTDLGLFVNETKNYLLRRLLPEDAKRKYVESPLDSLMRQYPVKKPEMMIGNMTLDEYVKQQLKSKG